MVRYEAEGIGTKLFGITKEENTRFWVHTVSSRLRVPVQEVSGNIKRIRRHNPIIVREFRGSYEIKSVPEYESAARLLAMASNTYDEETGDKIFSFEGPRGPRPLLASAANISSILGGTTGSDAASTLSRIKIAYGGIDELIDHLDLTASDIESWKSRGLAYSHEDVRRGLFLPEKSDMQTARALGLIEADGHLASKDETFTRRLYIFGDRRDPELYRTTAPKLMEEAFNLLQDQPYDTKRVSQATKAEYIIPELRYSSKGLVSFLRNIHFPSNNQEINMFGFDDFVKDFNNVELEEFLRVFIPFASIFIPANGSVAMYHPSRKRAHQLREMMIDFS